MEDSKDDISSVKANISALSSFKNEVTMNEIQDGWYSYQFETIFNSFAPKTILMTAVDDEGHKAITTLKVYVYDRPGAIPATTPVRAPVNSLETSTSAVCRVIASSNTKTG